MSSSSEDVPLAKRRKPVEVESESNDASIPSWLKGHPSPFKAGSDTDGDSSDVELIEVDSAPKQLEKPKDEAVADEPAGPRIQESQTLVDSKQEAAAATTTTKSKASSVPGAAQGTILPQVPAGELAVTLPEKLLPNRFLVELETTESGATDLAGDAGAVGRFILDGKAGQESIKIDLKGMVYNASVVECGVSMCVVNVGANEAKVEAVFSDFLQLREDYDYCQKHAGGANGTLDSWLLDDDDNYAAAAGGKEQATELEGKPGTKRPKKAAAASTKKPAVPKKKAVKKPAKSSRGGGKGKGKGKGGGK